MLQCCWAYFFFSFVWFRIELVENCETLNGYGNEETCVWQLMAYTKTWEADKLSRVSFGHMVPWETVQTGDVFTVLILPTNLSLDDYFPTWWVAKQIVDVVGNVEVWIQASAYHSQALTLFSCAMTDFLRAIQVHSFRFGYMSCLDNRLVCNLITWPFVYCAVWRYWS